MTIQARAIKMNWLKLPGFVRNVKVVKVKIRNILSSSLPGCKNVSLSRNRCRQNGGADTVEKVGEVTGAGTGIDEETGEECGKCKSAYPKIL